MPGVFHGEVLNRLEGGDKTQKHSAASRNQGAESELKICH
jgi:hypothetical protein